MLGLFRFILLANRLVHICNRVVDVGDFLVNVGKLGFKGGEIFRFGHHLVRLVNTRLNLLQFLVQAFLACCHFFFVVRKRLAGYGIQQLDEIGIVRGNFVIGHASGKLEQLSTLQLPLHADKERRIGYHLENG